jgi:hypothetical protein
VSKIGSNHATAEEAEAIIKKFARKGDVLTHQRCGGIIEEHHFTGWDGRWITGEPTRDTMRFGKLEGGMSANAVNDIAPANVLYINRCPLASVPFLAEMEGRA